MRTAAACLYALVGLVALGALIGGIGLIAHTGCDPNPYNDVFGTDLCRGRTHPFAGAGAAVLIGGLVNAAVIGVVGRLCLIAADVRDYLQVHAQAALEESGETGTYA